MGGVDWGYLAQDGDQRWAHMSLVVILQVS
jgi:hypothetical protein